MAMPSAPDITIDIVSQHARSEQRISPSWTLLRLKTRLAPITGIPIAAQTLSIRLASGQSIALTDDDALLADHSAQLSSAEAEIKIADSRPPSERENYTDVSAVAKYEMPMPDYEKLDDSVLAWKKAQKLGRFDPAALDIVARRTQEVQDVVRDRNIAVGARCRLLPDTDDRRGTVAYVGDVEGIPGLGAWVGVVLDEPTGKNDGVVEGKRYFAAGHNCGVFVRPHRVEIGDFPELNELDEEF